MAARGRPYGLVNCGSCGIGSRCDLGLAELTHLALATGDKVGAVSVNMGDTACKVRGVSEYIGRARARGSIGRKRKTVKC